jgi:hypothetical protein
LNFIKSNICQDRLGTNKGNVGKKGTFLQATQRWAVSERIEAPPAGREPGQVRQQPFIYKVIFLPRQARDKHRKTQQRFLDSLAYRMTDSMLAQWCGKETLFGSHCHCKSDEFTKTCSGQTYGQWRNRRFLQVEMP